MKVLVLGGTGEGRELAERLLAGYTGGGKANYKLSNNQEKQARAALARLVRDQMTGIAAEHLALAIDPQFRYDTFHGRTNQYGGV